MKTNDELFQEALQEVLYEEEQSRLSGVATFEKEDLGVKGFETDNEFEVEQDISGILEEVKAERDMRSDGLMKAEKGTRKFATIPITHIIEYHNKYGIDIMDSEVSLDKWEMAKFRMWIQKEHPYLMVRETGTRFNKTM